MADDADRCARRPGQGRYDKPIDTPIMPSTVVETRVLPVT